MDANIWIHNRQDRIKENINSQWLWQRKLYNGRENGKIEDENKIEIVQILNKWRYIPSVVKSSILHRALLHILLLSVQFVSIL